MAAVSGCGWNRFDMAVHFPEPASWLPTDQLVLFSDRQLILGNQGWVWSAMSVLAMEAELPPSIVLGHRNGIRYLGVDLPESTASRFSGERVSLRELLRLEGRGILDVAGLAQQLLAWLSEHRFCGRCGKPLHAHPKERALWCIACQHTLYPRINPCVIVLVCRGNQVLLARHRRAQADIFSCLAGFVEPGETPEQTVHREVHEEVGIRVTNLRYVKSQSWPFPSQLMLGFFADYLDGEVRVDGHEIEAADWFDVRALPRVPSAAVSVAGELIELYSSQLYGSEE